MSTQENNHDLIQFNVIGIFKSEMFDKNCVMNNKPNKTPKIYFNTVIFVVIGLFDELFLVKM